MSKVTEFINALKTLGDGRYHYWNGVSGVGCSDYVRMALGLAGVITTAEASDSTSLWAINNYKKVLDDTKRFKKHSASETPRDGWIEWYAYHHVAVYYRNGQFEAAPESSHYLSSNGKTAVGYFPTHHNCSGGALTCYYEIIESEGEKTVKQTAKELCENAYKLCMGEYGATAYSNSYPYNVGYWDGTKWSFDCLGMVHVLTATPNHFKGTKTLGGGATMDAWVNLTSEDATLKSCTSYGTFNGNLVPGELLQSSGHVGIYIGEKTITRKDGTIDVYNTAECTPIWGGCVLSYTDPKTGYRYNKKGGTYRSTWNYHGFFSQIDYAEEPIMPEPVEPEPQKELDAIGKLEEAIKVWRGEYGSNPGRKEKLTALYGTTVAVQIQDLVTLSFK